MRSYEKHHIEKEEKPCGSTLLLQFLPPRLLLIYLNIYLAMSQLLRATELNNFLNPAFAPYREEGII